MIGVAFISKLKIGFSVVFALCIFGMMTGVQAKSDHDGAHSKSNSKQAEGKSGNEKDIVLSKNSQATLYLLSGWGKADEPFVWYTVSAHFSGDQLAPNGKPFNLFSISGAQDCKLNNYFYYRVSYMLFDAKTRSLNEVFLQKNKTNVMDVEPDSIELLVKKIICK